MEVHKAAEAVKIALQKYGINLEYVTSNTDYGKSSYFTEYVDGELKKIRISDHDATNVVRNQNELMVKEAEALKDPSKIARRIAIYMYPQRFKFVETGKEKGFTHVVGGKFGVMEEISTKNESEIKKIVDTIEKAVAKFQDKIPKIQNSISKEVDLLVKSLDLTGDKLSNSIKNLKAIGQIQSKINKLVLNPEYVQAVKDLVSTFKEVAVLQNQYFKTVQADFKPSAILKEITLQSITATVEALTTDGLRANISNKLTDILRQNITTGASYADLKAQLGDFIKSNPDTVGRLERYTSQITTDALNQFNGQYMKAVTGHLGLKWHTYVGSNLTTSREFCILLTAKKFIYEPELAEIIQGNIDGHECELYDKTGLPKGMIDGTNVNNFQVYRGGYSCQHAYVPILENFVPQSVRIESYNKYGISYDEQGFAD